MNKKRRAVFVVFSLAWFFLLNYGYEIFVYPTFEYFGFVLEVTDYHYIFALIVVLVTSLLLPFGSKPSQFFSLVLFSLYLVPVSSYYALTNQDSLYYISVVSGCWIVFFLIKPFDLFNSRFVFSTKSSKFLGKIRRSEIAIKFCWVLLLVSLVFLVLSAGVSNFNLNLLRVYEFRSTAVSTAYSGVFAYLIGWSAKVCVLGLLGYYLIEKNMAFVILILFIAVLYFGYTHSKQALFDIFLVLGLFFLYRKYDLFLGLLFALCFASIVVLAASVVSGDPFYASILFRRSFFIPPFLGFTYYDYFDVNGFVYLSDSILAPFINAPFNYEGTRLAKIIGDHLGRPDMGANASFIPTSYMHFGYIGVPIFAGLTVWMLSILDALATSRISPFVVISFTVSPFLSLFINSAFFTSLATHGVLFALFLVLLLPNSKQ